MKINENFILESFDFRKAAQFLLNTETFCCCSHIMITFMWNIALINIPAFLSNISLSHVINARKRGRFQDKCRKIGLSGSSRRIRKNVRRVSLELGIFSAPIITRSQLRNNHARSERRSRSITFHGTGLPEIFACEFSRGPVNCSPG
jgi:hypothetical protein